MFGLVRLQAWKIRASVTIAWLAANPILPMVFLSSLVNSLRFDKTGGSLAAFGWSFWFAITGIVCQTERLAAISWPRRGRTCRHENGRRRFTRLATGAQPPARLPIGVIAKIRAGPRRLCIAQEDLADTFENFESRAFPQGFLNHLETAAP